MSVIEKLVRVEVLDAPIVPARSGIKDGRAWTIPAMQQCAVFTSGRFPVMIEVPAPDASPYRPGLYLLSGECLTAAAVNDRGGQARLRISFNDRAVQLIPLDQVAAALASEVKAKAA